MTAQFNRFSRLKVNSTMSLDTRPASSAVVVRDNRLYFVISDGSEDRLYDVFANQISIMSGSTTPVNCIMRCNVVTSDVPLKVGIVGNKVISIDKVGDGMVFGVYSGKKRLSQLIHPHLRINAEHFINLVTFKIVGRSDLSAFGCPIDMTLFVDNRYLSPFAPLAIKSSDDLMEYHELNVLMALKVGGVHKLEFYYFDDRQHINLLGYDETGKMVRVVVDYSFNIISCGVVNLGSSRFCR